eukprot:560096-Prymnesium_polylepis.1
MPSRACTAPRAVQLIGAPLFASLPLLTQSLITWRCVLPVRLCATHGSCVDACWARVLVLGSCGRVGVAAHCTPDGSKAVIPPVR